MRGTLTDCSQVELELDAFYDGELSPAVRRLVEQHLAACPECQSRLEEIQNLVTCLSSLPQVQPTKDLARSLPNLLTQRSRGNLVVWRPLTWSVVGLAAAVALVALVFRICPGSSLLVLKVPGVSSHGSQQTALPDEQVTAEQPVLSELQSEGVLGGVNESTRQGALPLSGQDEVAEHDAAKLTTENEGVSPGSSMEVATLDEGGHSTITGALGLSTDEDGLYAINL